MNPRDLLGEKCAELYDTFLRADMIKQFNIYKMRERLKSKVANVNTLSDDEVQALHIQHFPEYHI